MAYSLQASTLMSNRFDAACALLKSNSGENLVAIAGGYTAGIEVWNFADGSVNMLNSTFPLSGYSPQMIGVNGNTELIFYETGYTDSAPKGIWKFSQVNNSWTKIGEMPTERRIFSALPVKGVVCP